MHIAPPIFLPRRSPLRVSLPHLLVSLAALSLTHCSASGARKGPPGQLQIQVAEAPRGNVDPSISRNSAAMHSFMVGQLAYGRERFHEAAQQFSRASKLSDQPVPLIQARLAEMLVRSGDLKQALEESERWTEADHQDPYPALLKGGILEALGRIEDARATYRALAAVKPDLLDPHILYATLSAQVGKTAEGLDLLAKYIQRKPGDILGNYMLGVMQEESAHLDEALHNFKEVVRLNSDNFPVQFDILRVQLKRNDLKSARTLAKSLLSSPNAVAVWGQVLTDIAGGSIASDQLIKEVELLSPSGINLTDIRFKLAVAHIQEQHFNEGVRDLSLLLARDPNYSIARYYRASVYSGAGRKKEAIEDLFSIKPSQDMFVKSRTFAAFLLRQDHDLEGAERAVREALQVEPDNKSIFAYLILLLRDGKKYDAAEDLLNEELQKDPQNPRLLFNYGIIQSDLGDRTGALSTMERVIQHNPEQADALNFVAYSLAEEGKDLARASELVERALALSPDDGFYLDTLGWIHFQRGEFGKAEETLKRATSITNGDSVVAEHYGDALMKLGRFPEAGEIYRAALEKSRDEEATARDAEAVDLQQRLEKKLEEARAHMPYDSGPKIPGTP